MLYTDEVTWLRSQNDMTTDCYLHEHYQVMLLAPRYINICSKPKILTFIA